MDDNTKIVLNGKVIDLTAENWGGVLHTAFRHAGDSIQANIAYQAIDNMDTNEWLQIVDYLLIGIRRNLATVPNKDHICREPAEYQYRMRPKWGNHKWPEWEKCSAESYADYVKTPVHNDWEYQVRTLHLKSD